MAEQVFRTEIQIGWGDCDPLGIVYYPNYFSWFDDGTHGLLGGAGFSQREIIARFGVLGTPLVDAGAKFRIPSSYGDRLTLESRVETWSSKSFRLAHILSRDGAIAVEGWEIRVFLAEDPETPGRKRAVPVPEAFRTALEGGD